MNPDSFANSQRDKRFNEILAEYIQAVETGKRPDRELFLAEHAEFVVELREYFDDQSRFSQMIGPLKGMDEGNAKAMGAEATLHLPDDRADAASDTPSGAGSKVRYFGDYELLEEIARGGMGVVYKARQTTLKRIVALKMILTGQLASSEDVKRFRAEAEAAAKLEHANIVPIFEIGQAQGQHYFSMALIDGESLAHCIARGVLPPREAAEIVQKVSRAIAYAHVEGVVHRDLKPANILLDKAGEPHVTDFGLAKRVTSESAGPASLHPLTATGQILGTPSYMPPEQASARTKEIGPLVDVYALGAVLYCALSGRPPFQAATPLDTLLQVLEQEPVPLRQLNAAIPPDLETICMKCLEKERRLRYASAQELADELERYLNHEPIHARPISVAERTWRWLKKQRRSAVVGVTTAAATVILMLAGLAGWQHYRRSQLGYLQLKSASPDSPILVAEVFEANNEVAAVSFTVPTKEPVPLVAGSYRVRLSGSGQLSETYLLDVDPASEETFSVRLGQWKLFAPIPVPRPDAFEAVNLEGSMDFILLPHAGDASMRRMSAANGTSVWEVSWNTTDHSNVALDGVLETEEDRQLWSRFQFWTEPGSGVGRPVLVRAHRDTTHPLPDINGDDVGDLVWAISANEPLTPQPVPPSIVAVSGKDGRTLWWFRAKSPGGQTQNGSVVGPPVVVETGTGLPHLVALVRTSEETWVEGISVTNGESLWRSQIHRQATGNGKPAQPHEPSVCTVSDRKVLITVVGSRLVGIDAVTGEPAWAPHDLGFEPARTPQVADLDGNGSDDVLLGYLDSMERRWLMAVSLATGRPLWPNPVKLRHEPLWHPRWPFDVYVVSLGARGKPVVVLPARKNEPYNSAWTGLEVLDGATGARCWERRFPIFPGLIAHMQRAADRCAAGPDLDGDGARELFVVSARSDRTARGRDARRPSYYSLFVDALSGRDGHTIWWSRIPLGDVLPTTWTSGIGPVSWGPPGPDGRPSLVVPVSSAAEMSSETSQTVFLLAAGTGQLLHIGRDLWPPVVADWNRDGITDLCAFAPDDSQNPAGKIHMFRGGPPKLWQRLGAWEPAADFDGDGHAELFKGGTECVVASGHDGRITTRWKTGWGVDGIDGVDALTKHPLALPHGDLNRDGTSDVLFTASHSFFDMNRNRTNVNRPGQLFFPLQAFSGKTGERLWFAQDIPDPVPGNHAYLHVKTYSRTCDDLDPRTPGPDVLCPFSCYQLDPGTGYPRQVGLALFSGRDGSLRWAQMLEDEVALTKSGDGIWNAQFTPLMATTVVDLNVDGVGDVLVTAALRLEPGPGGQLTSSGVELIALDGRDGKRLWQRTLARQWHDHSYPSTSPQPVCGDIDGDGRPEVVAIESGGVGGESGIWTQYKVTAFDGQTGEPKWSWLAANPSRGGDPVAESDWPRVVLADLDGSGRRSVCVGVHDRGANEKSAIVVLDQRGEVRTRYEGDTRIWATDVDGDGKDEFVYVTDSKVRATRGGPDESLWEWPLPGRSGGILEIRADERGEAATIVVEAAGESTIDYSGQTALASFPPDLGFGARGDSIYGLDGATGHPIWRGRRDTAGPLHLPPLLRLDFAQDASSRMPWPALVNRSGNRTAALLVLPTDESGKYRDPTILAPVPPPRASDPRLLRQLPWLPRSRRAPEWPLAVEFLRPPAFLALYSLVVLVIPGWLLRRGVARRHWTVRGLLLVPVAFAIGFAGYKVSLNFAVPEVQLVRVPLALQLLVTWLGLPVLAFPALLVGWTIRRRWSRLAWLLGAWLVGSAAIFGVMLWIDSPDMDPAERYSWDGWYTVLVLGSIAASALTLAGMLLARVVQLIRGLVRRPAMTTGST